MKKIISMFAVVALLVPALASSAGKIAEAKTGKAIAERKIADESTTFALGEQAYLWLKVEGAAGETLTVTWTHGDQNFPVTLNVGGTPWRTWSSKRLHLAGDWTVTVTDTAGNKLNESKITVK
ncbi:MAG: DUF2914 domain-containing protein, partial [Burkholderiales bacterium]